MVAFSTLHFPTFHVGYYNRYQKKWAESNTLLHQAKKKADFSAFQSCLDYINTKQVKDIINLILRFCAYHQHGDVVSSSFLKDQLNQRMTGLLRRLRLHDVFYLAG